MNPKKRIIIVTWLVAACALWLLIPSHLLTYAWKTPRDPLLPHIFRENLQANAMRLSIVAAGAVALWHTVDARIKHLLFVFGSHAVVYVGLGAYLLYVELAQPMPAPLIARVGEMEFKIGREFSPHFSTGETLYSGGEQSVVSWKVCKGTLTPCAGVKDGKRVDRDSLSVAIRPFNAPFLGTPKNLSDYGLEKNGAKLVGLAGAGRVIDKQGDQTLYALSHPTKNFPKFVTVDPEMNVTRVATCFGDVSCSVGANSEIGQITYTTPALANQKLAFRMQDEAKVVAAIKQMQR